jgi:putative flippase GtrA
MIVARELFLFGLVGLAGFLVDSGVLYLLMGTLGLYLGRLVSFASAVFTTWLLNRHMTFRQRHSGMSLTREFRRYFLMMVGGGAVNYGVYALLVYFSNAVANQPVWGVAVGSLAGMLVNYSLAKVFVFKNINQ